MSRSVVLKALPPSVGDAPVAAVVLRDLAAALVAAERDGRPAGSDPAGAEVDDAGRVSLPVTTPRGAPTDLEHAALAAPELFAGAEPDGRSDVYAAALLALTRYLGAPPVVAAVRGQRVTTRLRLASLRQAQRTVPARLGALPAPYRAAFTAAVAKERHLRPTPERLLAALDAALAGADVETAARARLHRLVVLARAFQSSTPALAAVTDVDEIDQGGPLHLPLRSLPAFAPGRRFTRAALVAAVTIVATGGVAAAAIVGFRGDGRTPVPQAVVTPAVPTPSDTAPSDVTTPVAATSAAAVTPPATAAPAAPAAASTPATGGGAGRSTPSRSSGSGSHAGGSGSGGGARPAPPAPVNPPVIPPAPVDPPASNPPPADPPPSSGGNWPTGGGSGVTQPTGSTDPGTTAPSSDAPGTTASSTSP